MKNIGGSWNRDELISIELAEAGIPKIVKKISSFRTIGKLGAFTFIRSTDVWIAWGDVPLSVAIELYNTPLGKKTILVCAHRGAPSPEEIRTVGVSQDRRALVRAGDLRWAVSTRNYIGETVSVIPFYAITNMVGLKYFVSTLKKHNLV